MLKGIFWKPGVNGLGVFGFHKLPYAKLFDKAARQHDSDYDLNGTWKNRRCADIRFLKNELNVSHSAIQIDFAILYYILVRLFGWAFYRYNR